MTDEWTTVRNLVRLLDEMGVPYDRPVHVTVTDGASGLACRVCVAVNGLHADAVKDLPQTEEEFRAHWTEQHAGLAHQGRGSDGG